MENDGSPTAERKRLRWYYPTPGRLLVVLLSVEAVLLLSERFEWFSFNEKKGWTVLIAVGVVGVFLLIMLIWFLIALLFRWRFQFSIRSLLLLTIAAAVPCSWLAVEIKKAREQKTAVEAIRKLHGNVRYDYEANYLAGEGSPVPALLRREVGDDFFHDVTIVEFEKGETADTELKYLDGLTQLQALVLKCTRITDAGLEHLKGMRQLQSLDLQNTEITDAALNYLDGMTQLKSIWLSNTHISDAGLERLKGMDQLQSLGLAGTQITDAGLKHVGELKQLRILSLSGTKITGVGLKSLEELDKLAMLDIEYTQVDDAGLEHLKGLKRLQNLHLVGTKVTDRGIEEFHKALPKCGIWH